MKCKFISIDREVSITPNGAWGGEGSLGCGIGYGIVPFVQSYATTWLHRKDKTNFYFQDISIGSQLVMTMLHLPHQQPVLRRYLSCACIIVTILCEARVTENYYHWAIAAL